MDNLKHLTLDEQNSVSGGGIIGIGVLYLAANWIYNNYDDMKKGYKESYEFFSKLVD
jgi:hypothetical protein